MVAMFSGILHFLKVKLPLQNDQRWLPLLSLFSKIYGYKTPEPPFQKCVVILQSNTAQHKTSWKIEHYNSRSERVHKVGSTSLICDFWAKDLLYPLSVKYKEEGGGGGGGRPGSYKNARKFNVNLLFVSMRISGKQPLLRLK